MKKMFFTCSLLLCACIAQAQPSVHDADNDADNQPGIQVSNTTKPDFQLAEMNVADGRASFTGLPHAKRVVYAVITNSAGEFMRQARLAAGNNSISTTGLKPGLYFVTLVYRQAGKKAFVLTIS